MEFDEILNQFSKQTDIKFMLTEMLQEIVDHPLDYSQEYWWKAQQELDNR